MSLDFTVDARDRASEVLRRIGRAANDLRDRLRNVGGTLGRFFQNLQTRVVATTRNVITSITTVVEVLGRIGSVVTSVAGTIVKAALGSIFLDIGIKAVGALTPLLGFLAAIPAAVGLGAAAFITLKLAIGRVGDAFSAALEGDMEKFNEALQKLSPSARKVAVEFKNVVPVLNKVRAAAEQAFFEPLVGSAGRLAKVLGGPLQLGMSAVATQLGRVAERFMNWFESSRGVAAVQAIFKALVPILQGVADSVQPLLDGFFALATGALPAFNTLGETIRGLAERFRAWAVQAGQSGKALKWVEDAKRTFRDVVEIVGNVTAGIAGIFAVITGKNGTGALDGAKEMSKEFKNWSMSPEGKKDIEEFLQNVSDLAAFSAGLLEGMGMVLGGIGGYIQHLASQWETGTSKMAKHWAGLTALWDNSVKNFGEGASNIGNWLVGLDTATTKAFNAMTKAIAQFIEQGWENADRKSVV